MSTRKHLKPEIKASILKEFLQKKVPISELCERYSIQPSNIYSLFVLYLNKNLKKALK